MSSSYVYARDGYGGIAKYELDTENDAVWERGDLQDQYLSIKEFLTQVRWYQTIQELLDADRSNS